ncbi:MAG: L-threonylcarbamoyladenylate synthase [bacterium]|jgi:tRNA threonylcarbamoyl adenosine modification protein (Sua5/YciO/YrdC/YwlC family)
MAEIVIAGAAAPGEFSADVAHALKSGGVVLSTTDTVCGLLCRDPLAVARIFDMKSRPAEMPIAILVNPDSRVVSWMVRELPLENWMRELLPGPLTVVVPADSVRDLLPADAILPGTATCGIRAVYYPPLWPVIEACGGLVFATSANLHGAPAPRSIAETDAAIRDAVDLIFDGGRCPYGAASCVVEIADERWIIRRDPAKTAELFVEWAPEETNHRDTEIAEDAENDALFWTCQPLVKFRGARRIVFRGSASMTSSQRDMLAALAAWSRYNARSLGP